LGAFFAVGVGELGFGVVSYVRFQVVPVALVVADLFAARADGQKSAQGLHVGQGLFQRGGLFGKLVQVPAVLQGHGGRLPEDRGDLCIPGGEIGRLVGQAHDAHGLALHVEGREHDVAHLYYTSGTTGKPKGVPLSHKNVTTHALCAVGELSVADIDNWLHAAPMFHLADAWATFAFTAAGAKHTMVKDFREKDVFTLIENEGVTTSNMIPSMLNMLINATDITKYDLSSLRVLLSGGAPIAPELVRKIIKKFDCDYIQTYGMTETSPYLTISKLKGHLEALPYDEQLEYKSKTGREFLGVSLRVVREDGSDIEANGTEVGEIIVKGDIVTDGYWRLPEETARTIKDGWLYTEDLATIDQEGYVNIVDRKKDIIITGGENVYSTEVEYVLYEHPAVLEAAVVGIPDETWGEAGTRHQPTACSRGLGGAHGPPSEHHR